MSDPLRAPVIPRLIALLTAACVCALFAHAQRGGPGSGLFRRYPFDTWASENAKPRIKWNVRVDAARLSPHQRLLVHIKGAVESPELRRRTDDGQLLFFLRVEDAAGHRYQAVDRAAILQTHHGSIFGELDWNVSAFVAPGDYTLSMAVCDERTMEHSFLRRTLHVPAINPDPLPAASQGLLPVEFLATIPVPDSWYQPTLLSRIRLPFDPARPIHVEVLVNTTPSELGSVKFFRQNMELIVPSLKVLTGLNPVGGSAGLSVIDLSQLAIVRREPDLHAAEWRTLRPAFAELRGVTVDAKTLAGQHRMLNYFAGEAGRLLGTPSETGAIPHVLIVLSAPLFLTGQDPSALPDLPPDPARRIFYISYSPPPPPVTLTLSEPAGKMSDEPTPMPQISETGPYAFGDDLEHILKPMGARVFRVQTPEEFRKALGAILDQMSQVQDNR